MKLKYFTTIFILLILINIVFATTVDAVFVYGNGCPHCATAKNYIESNKDIMF